MDTDYSLPDVSIQPNKPPGFDGYNYPFWKFRMETYIKSSDIRLWDVIERGDHTPLDEDGFAKQRSRYTNEDYALVQLNFRAMHYIQCALVLRSFIGLATTKLLRICGRLLRLLTLEQRE